MVAAQGIGKRLRDFISADIRHSSWLRATWTLKDFQAIDPRIVVLKLTTPPTEHEIHSKEEWLRLRSRPSREDRKARLVVRTLAK